MNMDEQKLLFFSYSLYDVLEGKLKGIPSMINNISKDQFLVSSDDDIIQNIKPQLEYEPLTIFEDQMEMDTSEIQINVSSDPMRHIHDRSKPFFIQGTKMVFTIPYSGMYDLWNMQPGTWRSTFPRANVYQPNANNIGKIDIVIIQPQDTLESNKIKHLINDILDDIRFYINEQKKQINIFNNKIENEISNAIMVRRERLNKEAELIKTLNIPLKRKQGVPDIQPIPIKRKLVKPLPSVPKEGLKPEPGITEQDYEHILSVIRHVGKTFETTPKTYYIHSEEELRDIMLSNLNGHYQGDATGETFRKNGKTDIRIEDNNRNAFVAECKLWKGSKQLQSACDQLLSYLTWRDCKSALIIFNKEAAKFSDILTKVPQEVSNHSLCIKSLGNYQPGEWRYKFRSKEDEGRYIIVHVFLFNIYVEKTN